MAAPQWVTEGLRSVVLGAIFSSYATTEIRDTPAQKFALYSLLRSGGLQPMPRKPQAVTKQF